MGQKGCKMGGGDKKMAKKKGCISATLLKFGSTSWIRTKDPMINSHLLYQLS